MISRDVKIEIDGVLKTAKFECDRKTNTMTIQMPDEAIRTYTATDLYTCLGKIRRDFPHVKFLCKGAKINVHPSRMSSQMSGGIIAYEVINGEPADDDRIVNIFDYENQDITNNIQAQINHYHEWIKSLNKNSTPENENN
ncbi:hypothetical protein [Pseudomonas sp. SWRI154]|uniref:hypothetical protein n=1 Tax=Pseudomonas sp. SWRI154 TaxID=2745501 RepID=UPI0016463D65|nr:hypothetical protein [Pseudomonas sp. SWRI154]MBC3365928.1 hypothetical protein [Pseudomonas sp. SWRI154]